MKKLLQFLSSDSPYSTMRLGFITIIAAGFLCFLAVVINIIIFSIKGIEITQWSDMGIFLLCIGGAMTGLAWGKVQQKKLEVNQKNE